MLIDIVKYISEQILLLDRKLDLNDCLYLCRQDEKKGIIYQNNFDYNYEGIDDRKGNYTYLRFRETEEIPYRPSDYRPDSCRRFWNVDLPLRLVCVLEYFDLYEQKAKCEIEKELNRILQTINFYNYIGNEKNIRLSPEKSLLNMKQIIAEENRPHKAKLNYLWIVIDFKLQYITALLDTCINQSGITFIINENSQSCESDPMNLKAKCIIQNVALNQYNTVTHNLGAAYEVINVECLYNNANLEIDVWDIVNVNSIRVRPAGQAGTLNNVKICVEYKLI